MLMKARMIALALLAVVAATAAAHAEIKIHARVEAFDLMGNPITSIPVGGNFQLKAIVDDVRTSSPVPGAFGVFSAYIEAGFDSDKIVASGPVDVASFFEGIPSATLSFVGAGVAQGGGATSSVTSPGSAEQLLFTVPLAATASGSVVFSPSYLNGIHEWLMYGEDEIILPEEVQFSDFELTVVPEPASMGICATGLGALVAFAYRRKRG
jgi:hypothetical protein